MKRTPITTLAVGALALVLVALLLPVPVAHALEEPHEVDVTVPVPTRADDDGDGLVATSAGTVLAEGVEPEMEEDEDHHDHDEDELARSLMLAGDITQIELPSAPDSLILDDVIDGTTVAVRTFSDGAWSSWLELTATAAEGPDGNQDPRPGIGPIWLGGTVSQAEVRIVTGPAQQIEVVGVHDVVAEEGGPQGAKALPHTAKSAAASVGGGAYGIRRRAAWATSGMKWQCPNEPPTTARSVHGVAVHHTAGSNSYTQSQVPAVIRSIWYFHTGPQRAWCDIGYNFIVDRYGGVWEGRGGSLSKPVVGAHAGGYNTGSVGVAILGSFESTAPTSASLHGASRVVGYAAQKYGIDPGRKTTWKGFKNPAKNIYNKNLYLPVVSGHRNLGATSCPGDSLYARLSTIRSLGRKYGVIPTYHNDFLRRNPTASDVQRWASVAINSGYESAALGMAHSNEYAGLIVNQFYRDVLGRSADPGGRAYWVGRLNTGMRVEEVGVHFYGSAEYYRKTGGGSAYVTALYRKLLHRAPDPSGLNYWTSRLRNGTPPTVVAEGYYKSNESRRDRVARLYRYFLRRNPDPSGHKYWAEQLLHHDDLRLAAFLASSEEYIHRSLS